MAESLVIKILGDVKQFQKAMKDSQAATADLQEDLSNIAQKATIAFAGLSATITGLISVYRTQEQAEKKLETALLSTGFAAGVNAEELKKMASELQNVTTFGDEAIIESQALLLTFTKVGKDVFPKATESILNMSAAMGTDLKSSTIMIGKALNDPIAGVTALSRSGVQFTETQKEMIKAQVESGNVSKAQSIILKELEIQFGGQAKAAAEGTGRFIQLKNTFGDIAEAIGKHLVPPLSAMAKKFNEILVDILKNKGEQFGKTAASILLVATNASILTGGLVLATKALVATRAAVKALGLSFKGLKAAIVSTGIGAIIIGISFAVERFASDFDNNMELVKKVWGATTKFLKKQADVIKKDFEFTITLIKSLGEILVETGQKVVKFFTKIGDSITNFFTKPAKEATKQFPDLISRMLDKSNEEALAKQGEFTEQYKSNTQEFLNEIGDIFEEDNAKKIEKETAEDERRNLAIQARHDREAADLQKKVNRENQHASIKKKIIIDTEKFMMAAQKRELLHQLKSDAAEKKREEKKRKEKIENTKASLGTISTLMSQSNKTLFNIGKASAVAMALVDAPSAILKAWNTPWPLNLALTPLVTLAVGAQIASIASAQPPAMADGGMIMGAPGIDQNLAMLSRGELVVPTKNFEEVVGSVQGARNTEIFGDEGQMGILIGFDSDEAGQVLTAQQIEDQALGISIEEAS